MIKIKKIQFEITDFASAVEKIDSHLRVNNMLENHENTEIEVLLTDYLTVFVDIAWVNLGDFYLEDNFCPTVESVRYFIDGEEAEPDKNIDIQKIIDKIINELNR